MKHAEAFELIGAAALHALTNDDELAEFEQHALECETCAQELAVARRAAGHLNLLVRRSRYSPTDPTEASVSSSTEY